MSNNKPKQLWGLIQRYQKVLTPHKVLHELPSVTLHGILSRASWQRNRSRGEAKSFLNSIAALPRDLSLLDRLAVYTQYSGPEANKVIQSLAEANSANQGAITNTAVYRGKDITSEHTLASKGDISVDVGTVSPPVQQLLDSTIDVFKMLFGSGVPGVHRELTSEDEELLHDSLLEYIRAMKPSKSISNKPYIKEVLAARIVDSFFVVDGRIRRKPVGVRAYKSLEDIKSKSSIFVPKINARGNSVAIYDNVKSLPLLVRFPYKYFHFFGIRTPRRIAGQVTVAFACRTSGEVQEPETNGDSNVSVHTLTLEASIAVPSAENPYRGPYIRMLFPETLRIQDGWRVVDIDGHMTTLQGDPKGGTLPVPGPSQLLQAAAEASMVGLDGIMSSMLEEATQNQGYFEGAKLVSGEKKELMDKLMATLLANPATASLLSKKMSGGLKDPLEWPEHLNIQFPDQETKEMFSRAILSFGDIGGSRRPMNLAALKVEREEGKSVGSLHDPTYNPFASVAESFQQATGGSDKPKDESKTSEETKEDAASLKTSSKDTAENEGVQLQVPEDIWKLSREFFKRSQQTAEEGALAVTVPPWVRRYEQELAEEQGTAKKPEPTTDSESVNIPDPHTVRGKIHEADSVYGYLPLQVLTNLFSSYIRPFGMLEFFFISNRWRVQPSAGEIAMLHVDTRLSDYLGTITLLHFGHLLVHKLSLALTTNFALDSLVSDTDPMKRLDEFGKKHFMLEPPSGPSHAATNSEVMPDKTSAPDKEDQSEEDSAASKALDLAGRSVLLLQKFINVQKVYGVKAMREQSENMEAPESRKKHGSTGSASMGSESRAEKSTEASHSHMDVHEVLEDLIRLVQDVQSSNLNHLVAATELVE